MKKIIFYITLVCSLLWAGPNKLSTTFIDADPATPQIDSTKKCTTDSTITVGIGLAEVAELYGFQLYLQYDTSCLQFVSAVKQSTQILNFLESKAGSINFTGKKSKNDSTKILLAGSLTGDDRSQCATGSGYVAFITFKMKSTKSSTLTILEPLLLDYDLNEDNLTQLSSASVLYGESGIAGRKICQLKRHEVSQSNRNINVFLSNNSKSEIELIDTKGRSFLRRTQCLKEVTLNYSNVSAGFYILKIIQNNVLETFPLVLK